MERSSAHLECTTVPHRQDLQALPPLVLSALLVLQLRIASPFTAARALCLTVSLALGWLLPLELPFRLLGWHRQNNWVLVDRHIPANSKWKAKWKQVEIKTRGARTL